MLPELRASERFGHVVSFHLVGWAVLYYHIAFADLVGDKEIPIVDVPGSLAHALLAICFQFNSTGVVLENDSGFCWIA